MQRLLVLFLLASCSSKTIVNKPVEELPISNKESKYISESSLDWVQDAIDIADCITDKKEFHNDIINNGPYEHYIGSNESIVNKLINGPSARVGTYYKRFTRAIAYRNIGSDKIWFNRHKAKSTNMEQKSNTMIHERLHVLGFSHKGNSKHKFNNIESVPYKVGKIGEKYAKECQKAKK